MGDVLLAILAMSALGTKPTFISTPSMSALRGRADIPDLLAEVR
jgi:hypothetical protein